MAVLARQVPLLNVPVVELVGPAGAGKSTVMSFIRDQRANNEPSGVVPDRTHGRTARLAIRSASDWLPAAIAVMLKSPLLGKEVVRHMIRVRTMQDDLPRLRKYAGTALLFDEGPVLSLARISRACEMAGSEMLREYRAAALTAWSEALSMVVYLDAVDPVLASRINGRRKSHAIKGLDDAQVRSFLAWYRRHYAEILDYLAGRGVRVVHIDTSAESAGDVAERVAAIVGALHVR